MPTLNWIGKDKVITHHQEVPFRVLEHKYNFGENNGTAVSDNKIIHGDNLEALKALLPEYEGSIKCIYIDPPYNTGNENWVYNDNVNDPKIKKWLGQVVGKEAEDLTRHDKWLCMMYPRLKLLHQLLAEDGVIIISIDKNEHSNLNLILNDIFGECNLVGNIIWKNVTDNNPTNISNEHEYILVYAKVKSKISKFWKSSISDVKDTLISIGNELNSKFEINEDLQRAYTAWFKENKVYLGRLDRYKYIDKGGVYTGSQSVHNPGKEGYRYDVIHPVTQKPCKQPLMGYRFPQDTMNKLLNQGKILFGKDEDKIIELKLYAEMYEDKLPSIITLDGRLGNYILKDIFGKNEKIFDNPKPVQLLTSN